MALSKRHLNNQINEASIILAALNGAKAWSNHPCVLQYRGYEKWLIYYLWCLEEYNNSLNATNDYDKDNRLCFAAIHSDNADFLRPDWHTQEYYDNMKSRLFVKNPQHYAQFSEYGTSDYNLYYVDGEWRKYVNGKRVE